MTLDDASPQAAEYASAYPSDNDAMGDPGYPMIRRDLFATPDLLTLYLGFMGQATYEKKVMDNVLVRVANMHHVMRRMPTQDELDAITTHSSQATYTARLGSQLGFAAAMVQSRYLKPEKAAEPLAKIRESGRAPTMAEIMTVVNSTPPEQRKAGLRRLLLYGSKAIFWVFLGSTVGKFWGVTRETQNSIADPRLKTFVETMRSEKAGDIRKRVQESNRQPEPLVLSVDPSGRIASNKSGPSPYPPAPESEPKYTRRPAAEPVGVTAGTDAGSSQGTSFFDDDDASPTAPEYRNTPQTSTPTGSAWERIRQQNASGTAQPSARDLYSQPSQREAWGSASPESGKPPSDREQARAEFERLLEAERNAGSEEGKSKGWGRWN
ncbi:hypothetical protein BDV25DRAFT_75079 [Aspergillus avenaceus]|uniref:Uncharacterized protein n=1 Tax=Aspergillus avenaceus TaxID=36643 RepID=A0A5N6U1S3_ASPAV|nr:hypothetical protein BDV25DRAFT_75079 [Aspergillus avenaceus]